MTTALQSRVLVVDDDPDNADSLAMLLRANHYDAHSCHGSTECLEIIDQLRPEVVILDLAMPEMTGYQVAEYLRAYSSRRSLILVALSGYGTASDVARAKASGFDYHLLKPVAWEDLDSLLKTVTSERMAHASL